MLPTWIAYTKRAVNSSAAIAVEVVKELAPRCNPLTMRPSFWYCSIGNQNRSRIPWTTKENKDFDFTLSKEVFKSMNLWENHTNTTAPTST